MTAQEEAIGSRLIAEHLSNGAVLIWDGFKWKNGTVEGWFVVTAKGEVQTLEYYYGVC